MTDEIREAIKHAYLKGATDVHNYWTENPGEAPRGDPEFGEAASDYAASAIDPFDSAAPGPAHRLAHTVPGDAGLREALKCAINHLEHMAAWIGEANRHWKSGWKYSFESLGEDMPGIKSALSTSPVIDTNDGLAERSWQPIETAREIPLEYILASNGHWVERVCFVPRQDGDGREGPGWVAYHGDVTPTHWMPLPPPSPRAALGQD